MDRKFYYERRSIRDIDGECSRLLLFKLPGTQMMISDGQSQSGMRTMA
jgi:hypothetical protein